MPGATAKAQHQAQDLRSRTAVAGLLGKGTLYTLLGFLAISVALGNRAASSATRTGAIQVVAQAPFGKFLLIALTAVLVALVAWKVLQAIGGDPVEGSDASDRAKFAVKAVLYGGAALTSLSILIANWSGSSGGSSAGQGGGKQQATAAVLGLPGGRWLVMIAGVAAIGFGGYQLYQHAINGKFAERLGSSNHKAHKTIEMLGRLGYAGRSGVTIGVGIFLFIAGLTFDPNNVRGLSGILAELAGQGWGQLVLWLLALGVMAYGLFAFAEARYRRAT
ncbi:DUF1206 domain-containing protein [Mycobacterium sp. WMMD1722]|uniref:DUF1206 domain-containing protein n=1 Tax=Mycobacterium sp. WMMD1722 TaxID=3404117 RepID=UPI003BF5499B